jgi:hypothetical protein
MIYASSCDNHEAVPRPLLQFSSGESPSSFKTESLWFGVRSSARTLLISVEAFVWRELSLVQDIERVCVEREENGTEYRVISIVNQRDRAVRAKIYEREQAIMDAYPSLNFDFHVASRMNRNINEIVYGVGKHSFER